MKAEGLVVTNSKIGLGIFATQNFKKEEKVFQLKGKIIPSELLYKLPKLVRDNTYRISEESYISPQGAIGDFLNHSCVPNVGLKKIGRHFYICAIKNISSGKEILLDYSTILASDDYWIMKCKCDSRDCRKFIKRFKTLPTKIKSAYIKKGIVSDFVQKD